MMFFKNKNGNDFYIGPSFLISYGGANDIKIVDIDDVSVELVDESGLSPTYLPKGGAFKVVPNPSNGSFVIQCIENNLVTCSIQNLSGQEVYIKTKQAQNLQVKIDDATLAKGIYILKVADKNGVQCLKLVVE
jgi:hypothetical protein